MDLLAEGLDFRAQPFEFLFEDRDALDQAAEPLGQAAEPLLDTAEALLDTADPLLDAADPLVEGADPLVDAAEPLVEGPDPLLYGAEPRLQGAESLLDAADRFREGAEPLLQVGELLFEVPTERLEVPAGLGPEGLELLVEPGGVPGELFADGPRLGEEGVQEGLLPVGGILPHGLDLRGEEGPLLREAGVGLLEPGRGPDAELGLGAELGGDLRGARRGATGREGEPGAGHRLLPLRKRRGGRGVRGLDHRILDAVEAVSVVRRPGAGNSRGTDRRGGSGRRGRESRTGFRTGFRSGHGGLRGGSPASDDRTGRAGNLPVPPYRTDAAEILPAEGRICCRFRKSRSAGSAATADSRRIRAGRRSRKTKSGVPAGPAPRDGRGRAFR